MRDPELRAHFRWLEGKLRVREPQVWGYFFSVASVRHVDALADLANANGLVFSHVDRVGGRIECWFDSMEAHTLPTFIARYRQLEALARTIPTGRLGGCNVIARKHGLSRDLRANGRRWRFVRRMSSAKTRELQRLLNELMAAAQAAAD